MKKKRKKKSGLAVVYVNLKTSSLPAHFLPRPQSLLCRHTGPAAPKPEGQCREGSRGSDDSQTSRLRGRTEWDQINFNKLHRVKLQVIAKHLPLQSYWHMASRNIYSTAAKCQHSSFVTVYWIGRFKCVRFLRFLDINTLSPTEPGASTVTVTSFIDS